MELNWKKLAPYGLMGLGAAIALGVGFAMDGVEKWSLFSAFILFGAGFSLDKYL